MISLLAKLFIRPEGRTDADVRRAYGTLCGTVGILLNALLFAGKFFAGLLSGSIAIAADAFNTLSPREKQILCLRFYDGKTQMEVAGSLGISQAQVSRLEKNAIAAMRKKVSIISS